MIGHMVKTIFRHMEDMFGGPIAAIFYGILILAVMLLLIPIILPFLFGFFGIYAILAAENLFIKIGGLILIAVPYVAMFWKSRSGKSAG